MLYHVACGKGSLSLPRERREKTSENTWDEKSDENRISKEYLMIAYYAQDVDDACTAISYDQ